jgi:predicted porin
VATGTALFGRGNSHGSSNAFNADYIGNAFLADHVSYETPAFMGITANAAMFMDETNNADQNHSYGAGAEFRGGGLTAGAQFIDSNSHWGLDVEAARLYLGYAQDRFGVGASVEKIDHPSPADNANYLMLSGWYGLRTDTRLAFSYGLEDDSGAEGDSLRAGIFHDVLENFTVWAAARRYNQRAAPVEADVFTLGASYKFSLGFSS